MGKNSLRKKIMLKGVTTTPDDYLCEDGELAIGIGVESTSGGVEAAGKHAPRLVMHMEKPSAERVIFEHKVKPWYNWIVWNDDSHVIGYRKDNTKEGGEAESITAIDGLSSDKMPSVEAVGNTLIVRTENEDGVNTLHYVLWKPDDGEYKYLGTHIPEISIKFGLGIDYVRDFSTPGKDCVPYKISGLLEELSVPNFSIEEKNKHMITSAVMASVNKTQAESMRKGYFIQPFLVRYALKMYDGTTTMASAPVYMPVTEVRNHVSYPLCVVDEVRETELYFHTEHVRSKLKYMVLDESLDEVRKWSDIITGVEICVSAPIYTYKPSGEIEETYGTVNEADGYDPKDWAGHKILSVNERIDAYGTLDGEHLRDADGYVDPEMVRERRKAYRGWNRDSLAIQEFEEVAINGNRFALTSDDNSFISRSTFWVKNTAGDVEWASIPETPRIFMLMPEKSESEFMQEIKDCSNFYKIADISLEDIKEKEDFKEDDEYVLKDVDIPEGALNGVMVRPQMKDEYRSHDTIAGAVMKTYNARLNLAGVSRTLYDGFNPECWIMHYDERNGREDTSLEMTVKIKQDMKTFVVKGTGSIKQGSGNIFPYLYYPDTNADTIWLKIGNGAAKEFKMDDHTGLNGSVYFTGEMNKLNEWENYDLKKIPSATTRNVVEELNKLYTSQAENPWVFLPTNINTVGSGKILGIGAVTTALSQGQHGSFPMYCFTTEGIWSLSVNNTGGWSTSQTVTRDVMLEKRPILLIDDAIIFISDQGIMMLQGDRTVLMTAAQKGKGKIKIKMMPGLEKLLTDGTMADFSKLTGESYDEDIDEAMGGELMQYIMSDKIDMYYDYTNQRIVVGREDKEYCWQYYLDIRQWTVAPWRLINHVNTYPECYAMMKNNSSNHMVRLNTMITDEEKPYDDDLGLSDDILLLTRPIKLGEAADMLKELENMTVEGLYDKTKLGMAVWGTRNYRDWHLVGSCKGLHMVRKHGSGYRAFVVGILGKLAQGEYLDTITMEYQPRYVRKLHGMGYSNV